MIRSFRHKGLRRLFEDDDRRGVDPMHVRKLQTILARLDDAKTAPELDLPSFFLHPLKGDLKGFWAVTVRANWRVWFRFDGDDVVDVDTGDYH